MPSPCVLSVWPFLLDSFFLPSFLTMLLPGVHSGRTLNGGGRGQCVGWTVWRTGRKGEGREKGEEDDSASLAIDMATVTGMVGVLRFADKDRAARCSVRWRTASGGDDRWRMARRADHLATTCSDLALCDACATS